MWLKKVVQGGYKRTVPITVRIGEQLTIVITSRKEADEQLFKKGQSTTFIQCNVEGKKCANSPS